MQARVSSQGDYWIVEVYDENERLLIRVGFDHEPSREEIDTVLQSVDRGDEEWQP